MALCSFTNEEDSKKLIRDYELTRLSYKNVTEDWDRKSSEWYHSHIAIEDLPCDSRASHLRVVSLQSRASDVSEAHIFIGTL